MQNSIVLATVLFSIGLFVIVKGGDLFVDAARWVSLVTGIPKIVVGATVVSFATTLPELMVSIIAAIEGSFGISNGNAIGSVMSNLGIGLSVSMFAFSGKISDKSFNIKSIMMISVTLLLLIVSFDGAIALLEGLVMLLCLIVFMYYGIKQHKSIEKEARPLPKPCEAIRNIFFFVFGAVAIVFGADLLVDNGEEIARFLGVSDMVIGITVIAVGTSLPELTTAISAAAKKEYSLSVGNVIGANVIDICLILPICSLLSRGSIVIPKSITREDIPVTLLLMLIAVVPTIISKRFYPLQGVAVLLVYFTYLITVAVVRG